MDSLAGQHLPANWVTEIEKLRACQACYREPVPAAVPRFCNNTADNRGIDATPACSDFHAVVYHFDDMAVSLR